MTTFLLPTPRALAAALSVAALGLAACGGAPASMPFQPAAALADCPGTPPPPPLAAQAQAPALPPPALPVAARAPDRAASAAKAAVAPLLDDDGSPAPTAYLLPAHPVRTLAGLYASAAQFEWQERVSGTNAVVLDLDELGSELAASYLAQHVLGLRSPAELVWFIKGSDIPASARVADSLTAQGISPVFLVH